MSIGQEKKSKMELIASVQPLYAFSNALRMDVELKLQNKYLNFIISPEIYGGYVYDKYSYKDRKVDDLEGAGIGLSHKINLNNKRNKPYLNYGIMYRELQINYEEEGFVPYQKDGLEFYEYGPFLDNLKISSVLLNACLGLQTTNFDRFILDFYAGAGYKISSKKSAFPDKRGYDQEYISYAYNGAVLLAGIKFGFQFK